MPKFNGQTDKPLKIQLKSELLEAGWVSSDTAMGGRTQIEVSTAWVADGSTVKIAIKDKEGSAIETIEGKIYGNTFRAQYPVTKLNKTGGMSFEVELPDHGLKGKSGMLRVLPPVKISDLKLQDGDGKDMKEISREPVLQMSGKVEGPAEGTACTFTLYCRIKDRAPQPVFTGKAKTAAGKAVCKWKRKAPREEARIHVQGDLDKHGEEYIPPAYFFELRCLGVGALSADTPYVSWSEVDFGSLRGKVTFEMPDGSEVTKDIPDDGIVLLEKPKAGGFIVKKIEPNE